ncbi:MAG: ArsR family transcriptional regulator, partial [Verrucomicrobia bacterium]|nr:ArsR family transcriptional regulator [Verrucomicrobiota bacterium]
QAGPRDLGQLRAATGISAWALLRHLKKLEARGFVTQRGSLYALVHRVDGLGRELARLAG